MKIACLCVTENRAPVFGIAAASFAEQDLHGNVWILPVLYVSNPHSMQIFEYAEVAKRCGVSLDVVYNTRRGSVVERFDFLCRSAFDEGVQICTMWDDDDYAPRGRLKQAAWLARSFEDTYGVDKPFVFSYDAGWFCNLRTLRAEWIERGPDHLWGGCLTFNRAAWEAAGGFSKREQIGYDATFVKDVVAAEGLINRLPVWPPSAPIAFSHGKNLSTWLHSAGEDFTPRLKVLPESVQREITRAQQFLIDRRVWPPQPEALHDDRNTDSHSRTNRD